MTTLSTLGPWRWLLKIIEFQLNAIAHMHMHMHMRSAAHKTMARYRFTHLQGVITMTTHSGSSPHL